MASLVHKLTKNTPSIRTIFITTLNTPLFPKPTPSFIPHQTPLHTTKQPEEYANDPVPLLGPNGRAKVDAVQTIRFFPSFPFGYCLNPVSSTGFERFGVLEAQEVEPDDDDARRVWADSVKKKRKKKMNKHKYKKLRKRLRRKARAWSVRNEDGFLRYIAPLTLEIWNGIVNFFFFFLPFGNYGIYNWELTF